MGYVLDVQDRGGFLHFRITGENSAETVAAYLREIYEICAHRGSTSVLIEEELQGPNLTPLEVYRVISEASARTAPIVLKIAYLDVNSEHAAENLDLAEAVARDRGVDVRVYSNQEDAAAWLGEGHEG